MSLSFRFSNSSCFSTAKKNFLIGRASSKSGSHVAMPLVQYSSSSSDGEESSSTSKRPTKRRRTADRPSLPPLPDTFHDLYASQVRVGTSDDPALHEGRKRTIPHVEGNWSTHIYIEWYPSTEQLAILEQLIRNVRSQCNDLDVHSHLRSDVGTVLPLHISLSAPIVLRTDQKEDFLATIKKSFQEGKGFNIKNFDISFNGMRWASNKMSNRWFKVIRAARPPGNELNRLLEVCNSVADEYGVPRLYDQESIGVTSKSDATTKDRSDCFHVSLAWTLTNPETSRATRKDGHSDVDFSPQLGELRINCTAIKVKIGNVVHSISLSSHYENHKGILG